MEGVLPAWRTSFPTPEVRIDGHKASSSNRVVVIRWTSVLSADRMRPFCAAVSIPRENSTRVRVNRPLCRQLPDGRATEVAWDAMMRVPYPLGFYAKGLDGRIDDPKAGWKGRGLWATYGTRSPFHAEGGKGTTSKVLHFQLRPDPLAR